MCAQAPFRYDDHRTYPDSLLTVPLPQAAAFILVRTPMIVLESLRYRASIHTIECELPCELSLHLSAGLKYMLPTVYDKTLISQSWDDFVDRLRYSIYFKAQSSIVSPLRGQCPDFDPDYTVRKA